MAGGAPVIASNAGGLPEIIEPGVNGYMSPVGDVVQMSEHAVRILKDDATLQQFREEARKQAERFDIMNIVPVYEDLYARFVPDKALAHH
jgi:glycosyltransferase involved in cell wall biosynthesis